MLFYEIVLICCSYFFFFGTRKIIELESAYVFCQNLDEIDLGIYHPFENISQYANVYLFIADLIRLISS